MEEGFVADALSLFSVFPYCHFNTVRKEEMPVQTMKAVYPTMKKAGKGVASPRMMRAMPAISPVTAHLV